MTDTLETLETLIVARGLVDTRDKWVKNVPYTEHRFCMLAAIEKAAYRNGRATTAQLDGSIRAVAGELPKPYYVEWVNMGAAPMYRVQQFNDDFHTKHEDVLAVFDKAIAKLKGD